MDRLEKLKEKYSVFFPKNFYFECGEGWANILECLMISISSKIQNDYYRANKTPFNEWVIINPAEYSFKVHQIKEKFGSLRFYFEVKKDYEIFSAMVSMAELISERTCEETGDVGEMVERNGFYRILSPAKAAELGFKKPKPRNVDVNDKIVVQKGKPMVMTFKKKV